MVPLLLAVADVPPDNPANLVYVFDHHKWLMFNVFEVIQLIDCLVTKLFITYLSRKSILNTALKIISKIIMFLLSWHRDTIKCMV